MKRNTRQLLDIPRWDCLHANPHIPQQICLSRPVGVSSRLYQQRHWIKAVGKPIDWLRGMQGESVTRCVTAVIFDTNSITIDLSPEI